MECKKIEIRHEFYPSTVGCGPCGAWQGAIDVAEAKIKLVDGSSAFALYRREADFYQTVTYSINKSSYFEKKFDRDKFMEKYDRLADAKKSPYYPIFRQLLEEVKKQTKARKG